MKNSLPSYPTYKDSGVPWLGQIPAHWEVRRLKTIFSSVSIKVSSQDVPWPYIGMENVQPWTGKYVESTVKSDGWANLFQKGDLLFGKLRPYLAKVYLTNNRGLCSTEFIVYRPKKNINISFFQKLMISHGFISLIDSSTYGSKMPRANPNFISVQNIPLPPLAEQTAMAEYLDRKISLIDQAVALKAQQIERLLEYKQILIQEAVTRGLDPTVPMRDSGVPWIGQIPAHWEVKRLKYIAEVTYGISPPENTYNDKRDGIVLVNGPAEYSISNFGYTRSLKWTTSPIKFAKKGSLLFCLRGSTTGRLNICHQDLSIGRGCAAIQSHQDQQFLVYSTMTLKLIIIDSFRGSTFPSVTSEQLNNYFYSLPPLAEQEAIVAHIERETATLEQAIAQQRAVIDRLTEYKASLIHSVVTGRVQVVNR